MAVFTECTIIQVTCILHNAMDKLINKRHALCLTNMLNIQVTLVDDVEVESRNFQKTSPSH